MAYLEIAGPSNVRGLSRASEGKRTARWICADHRSLCFLLIVEETETIQVQKGGQDGQKK